MMTIVGTRASISGGIFSWYQANKAKGYTEGVKHAKKEIKKTMEYPKILEFKRKSKELKQQLAPEYISKKKIFEIQTIIDGYFSDFSDLIGFINSINKDFLIESFELMKNHYHSIDNNDFQGKVSEIRKILDIIIKTLSEIENEKIFSE